MRIEAGEFLKRHAATWIARQAAQFPVVNVHVAEIPASLERVWAVLPLQKHLAPRWHWRALFGIRGAMGKLFRWDPGMEWHPEQPLAPGSYYAFFRIEHAEAQREVGMSVENELTRALMAWVLEPNAAGTRLFNVTCALFKGRRGRFYWRLIRPFHNALIEDSLGSIRREVQSALSGGLERETGRNI